MADHKPPEVNTCIAEECIPLQAGDPHWFEAHMPCWICNSDDHDKRDQLLWNDECETYFHGDCIADRTRSQQVAYLIETEGSYRVRHWR